MLPRRGCGETGTSTSYCCMFQVLDKLDVNNMTVQHVVLASIPPQDPINSPFEASAVLPKSSIHCLILDV